MAAVAFIGLGNMGEERSGIRFTAERQRMTSRIAHGNRDMAVRTGATAGNGGIYDALGRLERKLRHIGHS